MPKASKPYLALLLVLLAVGGCSARPELSPSAESQGLATPALAGTISVPWIGQKTKTECGRAVLASLAARRGGDIEALYGRLPAPPDQVRGYSVPEMRRFGASVGVELTVQAPAGIVIAGECSTRPAVTAHFSRLAELVAAGKPVVVPVASGVDAGHYLVLVGAQSDGFIVLDPGSPGVRRLSTTELASYMCGFGYVALVSH
jgi:ABC-type bacteriocin/lantibiotic exporter with double-glycine peptidase domain